MTTTIQVPLDADLAESLEQIAEQKGVSLKNVINDLARQYLRQARREKIGREQQAYEALHETLKEQYLGQHIAIHEGQLVDVDSDPVALVRRIRQRFGHAPVLITQVNEQPVQEFMIRSPRLVQIK